jgi:hypothetical protein
MLGHKRTGQRYKEDLAMKVHKRAGQRYKEDLAM